MNRIKSYLNSLGRTARTVVLALAVVFVSAGIAQAASTISTNISTAGTLAVTGLSSLGSASSTLFSSNSAYFGTSATSTFSTAGALTLVGALTGTSGSFSTTLAVTGLSSLGSASSTLFSANSAYFGTSATSTFSTAGALTLKGALTLQNDEVITNAVNGEVSIGGASDTVKILGTASTSALKVGDEPAAPTINGMVFGFCSFANVGSFSATTTQYVDCTTNPTLALLTTDRVFVQATSSWDTSFVILAASSTAVSTVQLLVLNMGLGAPDTTLGGTSINFWALR